MSDAVLQILVGLVLAVVTGVGSFLFADQKAKGRLEGRVEKHNENAKKIEELEAQERDNHAEHASLKTTVSMLATQIDRLDDQKASKEVVDGFRREVSELKFDMDKRFDKLERLIIRLAGKREED